MRYITLCLIASLTIITTGCTVYRPMPGFSHPVFHQERGDHGERGDRRHFSSRYRES